MPSFRQQSSLHPMKGSIVLKPKKKQQQMEANKARKAKDPGKKKAKKTRSTTKQR